MNNSHVRGSRVTVKSLGRLEKYFEMIKGPPLVPEHAKGKLCPCAWNLPRLVEMLYEIDVRPHVIFFSYSHYSNLFRFVRLSTGQKRHKRPPNATIPPSRLPLASLDQFILQTHLSSTTPLRTSTWLPTRLRPPKSLRLILTHAIPAQSPSATVTPNGLTCEVTGTDTT